MAKFEFTCQHWKHPTTTKSEGRNLSAPARHRMSAEVLPVLRSLYNFAHVDGVVGFVNGSGYFDLLASELFGLRLVV